MKGGDWTDGYRAAMGDLERLVQSRELMTDSLASLFADINQDALVIEHEQGNRHQRKRLAAAKEALPLFSPQPQRMELREGSNTDPSPEYSEATDAALSYKAAISAIGEKVKAGAPLPTDGYFGGKHD